MHTVVRYLCVCAVVKVFLRWQRADEEVERDDFNSQ